MRTLFNLKPPSERGVLTSPSWPYVRDGLRRNLQTIVRYHRRNPQAVQSSHFLVRLLGAITIPHSMNLERYFDNVDATTFHIASALKMTSSVSKGGLFKGVFYGPRCNEILIAHNDYFDVTEAHRNWQNLQPVEVVRHPRSDLNMNLPDGKDTGTESGLAIITINIPMLALMYRAFSLNEEAMQRRGEITLQLSVQHFIRMYVLPNMLPTHLDMVLFNRLDNLQKGAPMGESTLRHSFSLPDYTDKVNKVHQEILKYLRNKRQDFLAVLQTIPAACAEDMREAMEMADMAPTRQVVWALMLARLPVLTFLFKAGRDKASTANQTEINQVRRAITSYKSDNLFESMLPVEEYYLTMLELDIIFQDV